MKELSWNRARRRKLLLVATVAVVAVAGIILTNPLSGPRALHLVISNQSLDHPYANMTVTVDGWIVVSGTFVTGNQHDYTRIDTLAMTGHIEVSESDTQARAQHRTAGTGELWVLVQFWWSAENGPQITIDEQTQPPVFD